MSANMTCACSQVGLSLRVSINTTSMGMAMTKTHAQVQSMRADAMTMLVCLRCACQKVLRALIHYGWRGPEICRAYATDLSCFASFLARLLVIGGSCAVSSPAASEGPAACSSAPSSPSLVPGAYVHSNKARHKDIANEWKVEGRLC